MNSTATQPNDRYKIKKETQNIKIISICASEYSGGYIDIILENILSIILVILLMITYKTDIIKEVIVLKTAKKFNTVVVDRMQCCGMQTSIQKEKNIFCNNIESDTEQSITECCTKKRIHRGVLYVYVLVVTLVVITLSLITASMFDNNLKNATLQRDDIQLYYYSKAGVDWAVDLISANSADLQITGSTESLLEQIKKMSYSSDDSSAVWRGENDLVADGKKAGHFVVEVDKVKWSVNQDNVLEPAGTAKRDYARVVSTGSYADGSDVLKTYTMTVLVPLDAPTEMIYLTGRKEVK